MADNFIPRGLQFAVLRAIPVLGLNACGTEIHSYLVRHAGEQIPTAQVYLALRRLQDRGLVTSEVGTERSAGRRGHPRRVYQLSASGLRSLEAGMRLFAIPTPTSGARIGKDKAGVATPSKAQTT
jgi:DNA-binding PadR family transcriptional regulator